MLIKYMKYFIFMMCILLFIGVSSANELNESETPIEDSANTSQDTVSYNELQKTDSVSENVKTSGKDDVSLISSSNADYKAGTTYELKVKINCSNSTAKINEGSVTFKINDEIIDVKNVSNSFVSKNWFIPLNYTGTYKLETIYSGSNNYNNAENTEEIYISPASKTIEVEGIPEESYSNYTYQVQTHIKFDSNPLINFIYNIKDTDLNVNYGILKCYVDKKLVYSANVTNGENIFNIKTPLSSKKFNVQITYSNDYGETLNKVYSIANGAWNVTLVAEEGYAGNTSAFKTIVNDGSGITVNSGYVNYYLNDKLIGISAVKNNQSILNYLIPDSFSGKYNLSAVYYDTYKQQTNHNSTKSITIYPKDTLLLETNLPDTYYLDSNDTLKVYLKDIKGNTVNKTGKLTLKLVIGTIDSEWGISSESLNLGIFDLINGESTIQQYLKNSEWAKKINGNLYFYFTFKDNDDNEVYVFNREINVNYSRNAIITGENIISQAGQSITFKGNVTNENGGIITDGRIVIKLNGKTITSDVYLNNSNHFEYTYIIPSNFSAKNYTITYVYVGNDLYGRFELNKTLQIVGKGTKIIADDVSGYADENITFCGSVYDKDNKVITSGRVVIKLNGRTINSNITLNNSKFTWTYTVPPYVAKEYVLTYVFVGNKNYQRAELTKTFTIKNQTPIITANNVVCYKDQTATVTVKITGAKTGIDAAKGSVGLKINGITLKVDDQVVIKNVTNGTAVFKFKVPTELKAGKYQIMITYSGGRYLLGGRANTSTLTVKDHVTKITLKIPTTKAGNKVRILASVNDTIGKIKTGNATFKLNNKVIGTAKISNGAAVLYYTIPENYLGKYTVEVIAQGTYTDVNSTKATLTVVK